MKVAMFDGDWLCYSIACAFQEKNPFDEEAEPITDFGMAKTTLERSIQKSADLNDCDEIEVHFSTSRVDNFRRDFLPDYKMNREGSTPPVLLSKLKDHCDKLYDVVAIPRLEADDSLGIKATERGYGESVIVSIDKDFLTIPAHIYNPNKKILKKQTRTNAFKSFIYQVMIGDSTDGYKGIPQIGPKKALKFINKHKDAMYGIWEPLVELASKKVDEEYLIMQARMAHILQAGDYNYETGEVRPWEPTMIEEMLDGI